MNVSVSLCLRKVVRSERLATNIIWWFEGDCWGLLRLSGTEPLVRIFAEAENRENAKTSRTHIVNFESRKIKKRLTLKYQSVTFYFFFVNTALATKTTITITATMIIMFMFDSSEVVFCTTANVCIKLSKSIYNIPAIIMHIGIKL